MKQVKQSDYDHQLVLDVPHVVAKNIRDMCREKANNANTNAEKQRYGGLANMIERELERQYDD